jgi:hypothetical protein
MASTKKLEGLVLEWTKKLNKSLSIAYSGQISPEEAAADSIVYCGSHICNLLSRQVCLLAEAQTGSLLLINKRLEDLIELANAKFNAYPHKDVPKCWPILFAYASIAKICATVMAACRKDDFSASSLKYTTGISETTLTEIIRLIDTAIIMTNVFTESDMDSVDAVLNAALSALEPAPQLKQKKLNEGGNDKDIDKNLDQFPCQVLSGPVIAYHIDRLTESSYNQFNNNMRKPQDENTGPKPLILEGVQNHWPARAERPWSKPSYLLERTLGGRRQVPVEMGRSYVDEGWSQKFMTFEQVLKHCKYQKQTKSPVSAGSKETKDSALPTATIYLAQYDLFRHIPSLRKDIATPDFCWIDPTPPHRSSPLVDKHSALPTLEEPIINAWFGPAGTISPLHCDPYHNILAQVVGRKYIRLYAPIYSDRLYQRGVETGGVNMENTCQVDIGLYAGHDGTEEEQMEERNRFPLLAEARYVECILEAGECLYIPLGWWHYVRSLSTSFSVSFWWN